MYYGSTYYDETTSLDFRIKPSIKRAYKMNGDGSTRTFTISDYANLRIFEESIDKVTVNGFATDSYSLVKDSSRDNIVKQITFDYAPAAGDRMALVYHAGRDLLVNTWFDLGLIPDERPYFAPPAPKLSITEIANSDIYFDRSSVIDDTVHFSPSKGTWEFRILPNGKPSTNWDADYRKIKEYLSGKEVYVSRYGDTQWERKARLEVKSFAPGTDFSKVKIDYVAEPYEHRTQATDDYWLWDPTDFDNDYLFDWRKELIGPDFFLPITHDTYQYRYQSGWFYWTGETVTPEFKHPSDQTIGVVTKWTNANPPVNSDIYTYRHLTGGMTYHPEIVFRQGWNFLEIYTHQQLPNVSIYAVEGRL